MLIYTSKQKWLSLHATLALMVALGLLGCSGQDDVGQAPLTGQVGSSGASITPLSHYAASRFLEQASMGPSPNGVAELRTLGITPWIQRQQALSPSLIRTPDNLANYELNVRADEDRAYKYFTNQLHNIFIGGEDQLRIRTSWVLSNFLVVSVRKIQPYGGSEYFNTLQNHAFGPYGDLLKAITRSPAMGFYLDNSQNRRWKLNENYGRELMQLFSVGLVQLNLDGTPKRDAQGKLLETYNQKDVIEATRALTGWDYAEPEQKRTGANWANYGKPMVAYWADSHDTEAKNVLGKNIAAGQGAAADLDSLADILVNHPNTAPFVSLRLIQGLVTSAPSPAYLQRVATVFAATRGHLGRVVEAILSDSEARLGDDPLSTARSFGRIKEPHLLHTSVFRGMGCRLAVKANWDPTAILEAYTQQPLNAFSVFNFYPPNHRAPGSKLLAPEQKTLNSNEFSRRMGQYSYNLSNDTVLTDAGCNLAPFQSAEGKSDEHLVALLGERYFRGAMPAAVAQGLLEAHKNFWGKDNSMHLTGAMLEMAMLSPQFGVSK